MAHLITEINNQSAFASVEQSADKKAWHGLGQTIVKEAGKFATKKEMMEASNLERLRIEKVPALMAGENGEVIPVHGKSVIRRADTLQSFAVMGEGFEIVQAEELAEFAETIIGESGAHFDTGGALQGGAIIFFSLKLPGEIMGGENLSKSMTVCTGNDGTMTTTAIASLIRPVCWNTLSASVKGAKDKVSIRHTKNWRNKVEEARRVLGITVKHFEAVQKAFEALRMEKISEQYAQTFISQLFPAKSSKGEEKTPKQTAEKRDLVMSLFLGGKGNEGKTKWDLFNGVTEFIDHHSNGRQTQKAIYRADEGANIEQEQRFFRIHFGQGAKLRQDAFELLTAN